MTKTVADKELLYEIVNTVFEYHNPPVRPLSCIEVIDQTVSTVLFSKVGTYCMVHVVSLPNAPGKCFVLCHYGDSPEDAGKELAALLLDYFGYVPEMDEHVRGKAANGQKTIPVLGFFVDKEQRRDDSDMQALSEGVPLN